MPVQPWVMRPHRSTPVASTTTSEAPEFASMPRCVVCHGLGTPSSALYWHIGETTMRLVSSSSLILYGENSALVMGLSDWKGVAWRGAWVTTRNGERRRSSQPGDRQRERLRTRHERIHHHEFLRRVRLAADRTDRTDRRRPAPGGEARVGAAAGELAFHFQRKII